MEVTKDSNKPKSFWKDMNWVSWLMTFFIFFTLYNAQTYYEIGMAALLIHLVLKTKD